MAHYLSHLLQVSMPLLIHAGQTSLSGRGLVTLFLQEPPGFHQTVLPKVLSFFYNAPVPDCRRVVAIHCRKVNRLPDEFVWPWRASRRRLSNVLLGNLTYLPGTIVPSPPPLTAQRSQGRVMNKKSPTLPSHAYP